MSLASSSTSGWTSKRVRTLRLKFGDTQEAFANRVGVSFTTLSRWENGHTVVSRIAQGKLAALESASPLKKKRGR